MKILDITFIHVFWNLDVFAWINVDATFIQNKVVVAGEGNTFIQNKVVVVRKICINFSLMLLRSLSVQGPSFTLLNHVGWLNFHDGKNVDLRFHGIFNGVTASEENRIFLGIFPGIFSLMTTMVGIIKCVLDLTGNMGCNINIIILEWKLYHLHYLCNLDLGCVLLLAARMLNARLLLSVLVTGLKITSGFVVVRTISATLLFFTFSSYQ